MRVSEGVRERFLGKWIRIFWRTCCIIGKLNKRCIFVGTNIILIPILFSLGSIDSFIRFYILFFTPRYSRLYQSFYRNLHAYQIAFGHSLKYIFNALSQRNFQLYGESCHTKCLNIFWKCFISYFLKIHLPENTTLVNMLYNE